MLMYRAQYRRKQIVKLVKLEILLIITCVHNLHVFQSYIDLYLLTYFITCQKLIKMPENNKKMSTLDL